MINFTIEDVGVGATMAVRNETAVIIEDLDDYVMVRWNDDSTYKYLKEAVLTYLTSPAHIVPEIKIPSLTSIIEGKH